MVSLFASKSESKKGGGDGVCGGLEMGSSLSSNILEMRKICYVEGCPLREGGGPRCLKRGEQESWSSLLSQSNRHAPSFNRKLEKMFLPCKSSPS